MLVAVLMPLVAVLALKETSLVAMGKPSRAMQLSPGDWPVPPYERMTQRLGGEIFDRATLRVPMIAQEVWGAGGCDRVDVVTIANRSTPRSVIYKVACHNGHQAQIAIDFTAQKTRG
ncbi:hypothetical protein OLX23_21365 [Novosphingobium sp. JCM 18896]|nr:hypothetical protein [Novosphingobium sp. JCM 18896]